MSNTEKFQGSRFVAISLSVILKPLELLGRKNSGKLRMQMKESSVCY